MKKQIFIIIAAVIYSLATIGFAEIPETTGTISSITVYRGQALVTRTVDIDLPNGTSELIVGNLPDKIVPESLYAQTSDDIKVLSVRYRQKAVMEDTREEVKELDGQIEEKELQISHAEGDRNHLASQWKNMYSKLRAFTIDAKENDLNRGLLTFEPIEKLTTYIEQKGLEYHRQITEKKDEIASLKKELELLNRKRQELDAGRSRTEHQAVLFIKNSKNNRSAIELSYLVNGANWLPQYNLRADPDKSNVLIEYNAVVNQTSGEDWNQATTYLSTAEPAMVAAAPVLEPMIVTLGHPSGQQLDMQTANTGVPSSASNFLDRSSQFEELLRSRRANSKRGKAAQSQLRQIAVSNQVLEFIADREDLDKMKRQRERIIRSEGISVTYKLPGKLTLPSRTDQQLVTIAMVKADANFILLATPLMTDYVYLQAEVLNDSQTVFLPGPASMFRNGEFVGKSDLPIVTIGEKFTAGFGIDSQVQVARELANKTTRIQGGNQIDTYEYRISLNNYKNESAKLLLLDRLPYTENNSIKIELLKTNPQLSEEAEYVRTAGKKGILRWNLNLKPNTTEQNATIVKYSYTMEYDRNMNIQPL
ncbi:MAG: mucoidy inhibitor MuiA family protein [Sedimentisphaerales bacterium]|nr:mucoidy inhibitor MuiA family protein [Sedimentisphaerales bacterium]